MKNVLYYLSASDVQINLSLPLTFSYKLLPVLGHNEIKIAPNMHAMKNGYNGKWVYRLPVNLWLQYLQEIQGYS